MTKRTTRIMILLMAFIALAGCNFPTGPALPTEAIPPTNAPTSTSPPPTDAPPSATAPPPTPLPPTSTPLPPMAALSISPGREERGIFISLSSGGDVDTEVVENARRTGNGAVLGAPDGNTTPDSYIQFDVDDETFFGSRPTSSILLEVEYLDEGTDTFIVEYDAREGGPYDNGTFKSSRPVYKTGTNRFKTASFVLKDIFFGNRTNGGDFRIADMGDGAETIRKVTITVLPSPNVINVDTCGANPWDDQPDSTAIQECINRAQDGDTISFTSGKSAPGYQGYLVDRTIFLNLAAARKYLTITSTDPGDHALLKATADLKGFVVKLFARSRLGSPGEMDYLTITNLSLDGNRQERTCFGPDGIANGLDDNYGSYLPECSVDDDAWCRPGTLDLPGSVNWEDPTQTYRSRPERWTVGFLLDDLYISNTECGTALGLGGASHVIMNSTIELAGDHVHAPGCAKTDDSDLLGDWSDGITFDGPNQLILNNTVINPSDVGIVFFGGRETIIRGNTVIVTPGNYGAFAGIAVHPWGLGDLSNGQVVANTVISEGDERCGGLHTGINLGPHMWGGACLSDVVTPAIGRNVCMLNPIMPEGALCPSTGPCQVWASVSEGATYTLADNSVTGAHVNYLIGGFDLQGNLIEFNNTSIAPRRSDWEAARLGCHGITWGPTDKIARDPILPGWRDLRIHCER